MSPGCSEWHETRRSARCDRRSEDRNTNRLRVVDESSFRIFRSGVASVTPNQAVVWTQPTDWNVDLENPKNGILDDNNKEAVFARADGSTGMLKLEMSDAQIKALLTKDGGDLP